MIDIGSRPWLMRFGGATPRKILFAPDFTFQLSGDKGRWDRHDNGSLMLSGDFLPVDELRFIEDGDSFICRTKPPILIYPGVDRSDIDKALRECNIPSSELMEVKRIKDRRERDIEAAKLLRNALTNGGFYHGENYYQSSNPSLILIIARTAQIPSLDFDEIFPIEWMDADNQTHEFEDSAEWFAFNLSLQRHIEKTFRACQTMKEHIANGDPYDLRIGWPKTRFPINALVDYLSSQERSADD